MEIYTKIDRHFMPFSLTVQRSGLPPQDLDNQRFHLLVVTIYVVVCEFSCLSKLAKPYSVFGLTYVTQVHHQWRTQ